MEQNGPNLQKHAASYGVLLSLISIVFTMILWSQDLIYATSIKQALIMGAFNIIFTLVILFLAVLNFKKANEGFLEMKESIKITIITILISSLIGVVFQFVFRNYIEPDFIEKTLKAYETLMLDMQPQLSDEDLSAGLEQQAKSLEMSPSKIGVNLAIMIFVAGLIPGALIGLILKKKREA